METSHNKLINERPMLYEAGLKYINGEWYEYETKLIKHYVNPLDYFKECEDAK